MTYDLCIIGAGVGGGALAHALAPTGKRILLLNRLGSLPREAENWDPKKLFTEDRYKADERWTDDATGDLFRPGMYYWLGGNTKVYGSALLRNSSTAGQARYSLPLLLIDDRQDVAGAHRATR